MKNIHYSLAFFILLASVSSFAQDEMIDEEVISEETLAPEYALHDSPSPMSQEAQEEMTEPVLEETEWTFPQEEDSGEVYEN